MKRTQRIQEWAINVLIAWFNGLNARGSDVGDQLRVHVGAANNRRFTIVVSNGLAGARGETVYEVTVKVKKLGKR